MDAILINKWGDEFKKIIFSFYICGITIHTHTHTQLTSTSPRPHNTK